MQRWILGTALTIALVLAGLLLAYGLGLLPPAEPAPEVADVSPAAAASAEMKLARLDSEGEEARLTDVELTSLFRYRPEVWSLGVVKSPSVTMAGDTLWVAGRVAADDLPPHPEIDRFRLFLPDTASVQVAGTVRPLGPSMTILQIGSIEIAGMPIPSAFFSQILDRFGQDHPEELPPSAIALPLPGRIGSARVENGELVLTH